jgi:lysophospholipase L1-like esterase
MNIACYGDSLTAGIPGVSYVDILRQRWPQHTLLNYGRIDETVISLYWRITRQHLLMPVDVACLWIGTNDAIAVRSRAAAIYRMIRRQPQAQDAGEFQTYYRAILELLHAHAGQVVTASPLCIGEELSSPANQIVVRLSNVISQVSASYTNVRYLDLHAILGAKLAGKPISTYRAGSVSRVMLDALMLRSQMRIDRVAVRRGLHVTLDGVHLNSAGAQLVADAFMQALEDRLPNKVQQRMT